MAAWSAGDYLQFADERTRPATDLLAQVRAEAPARVVDIGCGPGNSTELLARRWPAAAVSGFDSSEEMLAAARRALPALRFFRADAAAWLPEGDEDVLFSNAALQWVPDHLGVMERMLAALRPGATLAVQIPDNLAEPSHAAMRQTAAEPRFAALIGDPGAIRQARHAPGVYYDRLRPLAGRLEIWHTVYNHALAGIDAVVEWVRATGLRPFLDPLGAEARAAFTAAYRERLAAAYPPQADGRVLLRFPRLFVLAERA